MATQARRHREDLYLPAAWWLLAIGFALSLVVAVAAYTNIWLGWATALVTFVGVGGVLFAYGRPRLQVDEHGIRAGGATVEWPWVASVEALDQAQTQQALGPGGNARAWMLTRPYVKQSVRVFLDDPADPHPYWLVSSRHPEAFVSAANSHLSSGHG
ncbi:DUF3093 domain-containing protein [Luteococcus sp.]|uniref:DUF3093 domain-containing protein n=1 Tax=Luteococcus sp. TaxID=1969402 RepID=UPI0037352EE3